MYNCCKNNIGKKLLKSVSITRKTGFKMFGIKKEEKN
jgi:hypothetical protein